MNPELVFARTPEGERLARSPRQIGSYGHRATLLLVDGQITVGELRRRFGETLPIETVLRELEHDGLVYPKAGIEAADQLAEVALPEDMAPSLDPLFDPAVEHIAERHIQTATEPAERREPTLVRAHTAREESEVPGTPPLVLPLPAAAEPGAVEPSEPPRGERSLPPAFRRLGPKVWWLGIGLLTMGLVVGFTLWLTGLRPSVEARASEALGVPVTVGSLGPAFHRGPALTLHDVTIGRDAPLVLPRVDVMPDPHHGNVWSSARVLILNARLKPSELDALAGLLRANTVITETGFSELALRLGSLHAGALAGSLEITAGGAVFKLADPAGGLTLEARPTGHGLETYVAAAPGMLPLLGRPRIGTVELRGLLDDDGLSSGEIGMTGYGGKFEGSLAMRWAGPVSVDARLRMAAVSMSQLSRSLFERGGFSEGQASGTLAVETQAPRWEDLVRIDRLTGNFNVERGAFKGFDLGAALRERAPRPISGGETRFDSLRGRLEAGPQEIRLWLDRLDAGALTVSGQLTVTGLDRLKGNLSAAVQVPGHGALRYPAQVSGTVALPSVQLVLPASGERSSPTALGSDRGNE